MRRFASCFLILAFALCLSSLSAAGRAESTDTPHTAEKTTDDSHQAGENRQESTDTADEVSTQVIESDGTVLSVSKDEKGIESSGTALSADKETDSNKPADLTFASIHSKGLTVAEGNKWYYETFDRQGRSSFAVLYEDGTAVEKTEWVYKGTTRYPSQKKILRMGGSETFNYDEAGRELSVERYEGKTLMSKTENIYNGEGKLIEQTTTAGKNTDKSVWEFAKDKAVAQTTYRNGKKTSFIELHHTPHILHLYVDDKEVYVGEE